MASVLGNSSLMFVNRVGYNIRSPIRLWNNNMYYCTHCSTLEPPNVEKLAKKAHINLTPLEVEDFGPKISQVIDWFRQLQGIDLEPVVASLRADTDPNLMLPREDIPETFENREAVLKETPSFSDSYIKVPKVLNKE